ncbi:MAG: hypothetical protein AB1457_07890 [Chloroflexota bacterium]
MEKQKFYKVLLIGITLGGFLFYRNVNAQSINQNTYIFLPIILNKYCGYGYCKFIGIFMDVPMWNRLTVSEMDKVNNISSVKHSVVGWSISLENKAFLPEASISMSNNFYGQLEALWEKGYVSFINISTEPSYPWTDNKSCPYNASAKDIAEGKCDNAIDKMAELYKSWIDKGANRKAFIAPLPEMNGVTITNGPWTSYGGDADNFKNAFARIQQRFESKGVSKNMVWWVFAPNGWNDSTLPQHAFEKYYPGHDLVDVLAFSSYNFGYCWKAYQSNSQGWYEFESVFKPYIDRFKKLAPSKPIIIAQTGVTAEDGNNIYKYLDKKNDWLENSYRKLAHEDSVLGVVYFDAEPDCKWSITKYEEKFKQGYEKGTMYFLYLTAVELDQFIKKER